MCRSCWSYWDFKWTFAKRNFALNFTGFGGCLVTSSINARWRWVLTPFLGRVVGFERGSGLNLWVYKRKFGSIGESPSYQRARSKYSCGAAPIKRKKRKEKEEGFGLLKVNILGFVSNSILICSVFISYLVQGFECSKQTFVFNWWTENASYFRKQQKKAERPFSGV